MEYKKVIVVIPARNEGKTLPTTLQALLEQKYPIEGIFIANDGSTDNTREVALSYDKVFVTDIEDRGYDAVGKAVLANTFNAGFKIAIEKVPDYDYLLIVGADTILPHAYLERLIQEFDINSKLAIVSGNIPDETLRISKKTALRGSGRLILRDFWKKVNEEYPVKVGWESYPIYKAMELGYQAYGIPDIKMQLQRPTGGRTDYHAYGEAMRALGYYWVFAYYRAIISTKSVKAKWNMLIGYIRGKERYEDDLRKFTRRIQKRILFDKLFRKRKK